jgi:Mannosyltransferase (PIG-V)
MNPDTAELAIVESASEPAVPFEPRMPAWPAAGMARRPWTRLRAGLRSVELPQLDAERATAVRESWRALWSSRLLVWAAGVGTLVAFGFGPVRHAFNPPGLTRGFGWLGDLLAAPAARWDSAWYLVIAHYGYRPDLGAFTSPRTAFFPLYPFGLKGIALTGVPPVLAGVLLSLIALGLALYGIHRLTTLELGAGGRLSLGDGRNGEVARLAVMLTAFAPMAFYLSAVYSESLYLALSVGLFWSARQGRWALAGVIGALAAGTRSTGLVLALPALVLYLYGPRLDRPIDFSHDGPLRLHDLWTRAGAPAAVRALLARMRPRYRLRRDVLWLALLPAGVVLYGAFLALGGGDALAPFHAQDVWGRHFAGPYLGVWDALQAAFDGLRQLLSLQSQHSYFPLATGNPFVAAGHNLFLLGFLLAAIPATVGVLRRLPLAYGAYVVAALALPLSYPVAAQPLMSLPRFLVVLFPLNIWFASWLAGRPRVRRPAIAVSALLMAVFVAQFATWHWVA